MDGAITSHATHDPGETMAELFYRSLPGFGGWESTIKQVGAQLRPYYDFLFTAKKAAEGRKSVLGWRKATPDEHNAFHDRFEKRWESSKSDKPRSNKRRDQQQRLKPSGYWIVLETTQWRPDEPDETFDLFMETPSVYCTPECFPNSEVRFLETDREGRAVLVDRLPVAYEPETQETTSAPPNPHQPRGQLIWLRPNVYALDCQIRAFRSLDNTPNPRVAPLVRLTSTKAQWPSFAPEAIAEDDWYFLRTSSDGRLRDGTDEQRRFVEIALETPDFAILEGPPGSGKTTAICELITQVTERSGRVLLVASTHVAVDNVLERLIEWQDKRDDEDKPVSPVRIGDENRVTSDMILPFTLKRQSATWLSELKDFLDDPPGVDRGCDRAREIFRSALSAKTDGEVSPIVRMILEFSNLVCGTTIGILQHPAIKAARRDGAPVEPFDLMILDEASKTTFGEFLVPAMFARRWVVVGDIKQLSPYVEESELADNIRNLAPPAFTQGALCAFLAAAKGHLKKKSVVSATLDDARIIYKEARARNVDAVLLDDVLPTKIYGIPNAVVELLYADMVVGTPPCLRQFEHRLPHDLQLCSGSVPALSDWQATRRAAGVLNTDDSTHEADWASEIAWRLVRSYELRQNIAEKNRHQREIEELFPKTLNGELFASRNRGPRTVRDNGTERLETASDLLRRDLDTVRRVAMPSILELLQVGFERLQGWTEGCALTDGLPSNVLKQRLVSLSFQHRMHPELSAFPREQFYQPSDDHGSQNSGVIQPIFGLESQASPSLLRDADGMAERRQWTYSRYARRAMWLSVEPQKRSVGVNNSNLAEVKTILGELKHFVNWATTVPKQHEVAILTFYRGQEALFRHHLQRESGQFGNTRTFRFGNKNGQGAVKVTLCTVDRFQGHEADLVFLSFVKSGSIGFLNSPNRLNVALTRARYQLVLVGHRAFFASDLCRSPLLQQLAQSHLYAQDIHWEVTE